MGGEMEGDSLSKKIIFAGMMDYMPVESYENESYSKGLSFCTS